jgi:hypothetical protein
VLSISDLGATISETKTAVRRVLPLRDSNRAMKNKLKNTIVAVLLLAAVSPLPAQTNVSTQTETNAAVTSLPRADYEINLRKEEQFVTFDPHYKEAQAERVARTRLLGKQVLEREATGQNVELSYQILFEIIWRLTQTADFKRLDQRLDDLQASLAHPEHEMEAEEQDPADGSWGRGYTEWFLKLSATWDHHDQETRIPLRFLDKVNSPEKLTDYLTALSVSDIARTGVDHYREFNEALSCFARMIPRDRPKGYVYDPKLKETFMDLLLHRFRNPATGYWGESYVQDGHVQFIDDLSITFHTITYLHGNVSDLDKVAATTLAIKDLDFPVGWLYKGQYWNHNNLDVVGILQYSWPHASAAQKKALAIELNKMLRWTVDESLQPDGSFKRVEADGSVEEKTHFGAAFLARVGYFDKSKRFWTDQDFPEAEGVRQRIIGFIEKHRKSGAMGGTQYESALEELNHTVASSNGGK